MFDLLPWDNSLLLAIRLAFRAFSATFDVLLLKTYKSCTARVVILSVNISNVPKKTQTCSKSNPRIYERENEGKKKARR